MGFIVTKIVYEPRINCYHKIVKHKVSSYDTAKAACPSGLRERIANPNANQSQQEVTTSVQQDCSTILDHFTPQQLEIVQKLGKLSSEQLAGLKALLDGLLGQLDGNAE